MLRVPSLGLGLVGPGPSNPGPQVYRLEVKLHREPVLLAHASLLPSLALGVPSLGKQQRLPALLGLLLGLLYGSLLLLHRRLGLYSSHWGLGLGFGRLWLPLGRLAQGLEVGAVL